MNEKANQLEAVPEDQPITKQDFDLGLVVQSGITMKDVAQLNPPSVKSTAEAILALKIGNARFFRGYKLTREFSAVERRAQTLEIIYNCSAYTPIKKSYKIANKIRCFAY